MFSMAIHTRLSCPFFEKTICHQGFAGLGGISDLACWLQNADFQKKVALGRGRGEVYPTHITS